MVNGRRKQTGQQLLLRFPEGSDLRDRLEEIARSNNRSLTAEIIHRLEASVSPEKADGSWPTSAKRIAEENSLSEIGLEKRLADLQTVVLSIVTDDRVEKLEAEVTALKKRING